MSLREQFGGVVVPVVTPFRDDGSLDLQAAEKIALHLVLGGVKLFLLGTTGEGASLSSQQKTDLVGVTVRAAGGKQPVLAGIPGNSFQTVVEEGKRFASLGVAALVATIPNYFPMDDDLILRYFENLADALPLPLFLYNMPLTIHRSLPLDVLEKLSHHPNIAGLKDSEKNLPRMKEALDRWKEREDFIYLVGNAASSVEGLLQGAAGIVPGTGNLCPRLYRKLFYACRELDIETALELQHQTNQITGLYQGSRDLSHSLAALKVLMNTMGLCGTQVLPPLIRMESPEADEVRRGKEMIDQMRLG